MDGCDSKGCSPNDLTGRRIAWLLWYVPIGLIIAGSLWSAGGVWLWVPAFVIMGVGCLINAARCGRTHCYITGLLFLLAALYVVLAGLGVLPLNPTVCLIVVFGICFLAQCAETPLGRHHRRV